MSRIRNIILDTVKHCYILFGEGGAFLKIIIQHNSSIPIYEQIMNQIKGQIVNKELRENDSLPSVRIMAKELSVSALTVKKAYDQLDELGFINTVHGKGSYVSKINSELMKEEQVQEIQAELEKIIKKSRNYHISDEEVKELVSLLLEE